MGVFRCLIVGVPGSAAARRFLFVSLVDAVGTGMFFPVAILYLTRIVGLSAGLAGLGLGIATAVSLVATPLSGSLADRADSRTMTVVAYAALGLLYLLYTAARSFWAFVLIASAIEVGRSISLTSRRMMIFSLAAEASRVELLAYMRSIRNIGFGIGGLLAAAGLATGSRNAYSAILIGNALSYGYAACSFARLPPAPAPPPPAAAAASGYRAVLRHKRFIALSAVTSGLTLNTTILQIGIALWVVHETTAPTWIVGLLFTLNTIIVVVLQVPTSRGTDSPPGIARAYLRAGITLALACTLFIIAAHRNLPLTLTLLIAATIMLTIGEMFSAAAEWATPTILAPTHLRGRYLALIRTATTAQDLAGPALVSTALTNGGQLGFAALGATLLTAGLLGNTIANHN